MLVQNIMPRLHDEAGFSYIEALVAIAVVAIVLIPLLNIFVAGHMAVVHSGHKTTAVNLCREKIEEAGNRGYSYYRYHELTEAAGDGFFRYIESEGGGEITGFSLFSRHTLIECGPLMLPGELLIDLMTITVKVSWRRGDKICTVILTSKISDSP